MNKKVIIIGVVSALLIGGGVFWWMRGKKKAQDEAEAKKKAEEEAAAKAAEEAAAREKESSNKATQSTPKETYPATPFKSKEEGNAFRAWVNKTKPDWRLKGDVLAPTGEFDNSTIRAAYKEFGSAYQAELKKLADSKKSVAKSDKQQSSAAQRKAFGEKLYNQFLMSKKGSVKIRPIGGKDIIGNPTYYYDSGRKTYTKDGNIVNISGDENIFDTYIKLGYNAAGYWWLQKGKAIISVNPYEFEAINR